VVGDPEDVSGVVPAHGGQTAALAEEAEGVLEDLAVGSPAVGGVGIQGGGGLGVASGLGQDGAGGASRYLAALGKAAGTAWPS
jgi:hypothetical protein